MCASEKGYRCPCNPCLAKGRFSTAHDCHDHLSLHHPTYLKSAYVEYFDEAGSREDFDYKYCILHNQRWVYYDGVRSRRANPDAVQRASEAMNCLLQMQNICSYCKKDTDGTDKCCCVSCDTIACGIHVPYELSSMVQSCTDIHRHFVCPECFDR